MVTVMQGTWIIWAGDPGGIPGGGDTSAVTWVMVEPGGTQRGASQAWRREAWTPVL